MTRPLLALMLVSLPFVFGPDNQVVEGVLGYRAWNFYNLLFFYAYLRVEREEQVRWIIQILTGIGLVVAAYGIYQFIQGPEKYLTSPEALARHEYSIYYAPGGEGKFAGIVFRPYSTLNSAGALGGTLAGLIILALFLLLDANRRGLFGRALDLATLGSMWICLILSGSRGAIVIFVVGVLALFVFRRRVAVVLVVALLAGVGLSVVNTMTESAILQRLESLDPTGEAAKYESYGPRLLATWGGISYMWDFGYPLGIGLGTTGVGVPTVKILGAQEFRGQAVDSEYGRAAIEMGGVGLILILYLVGSLVVSTVRAGLALRGTRYGEMASALAALLLGYLPITLLGSPLYGPPISLLIWLSLGTLLKLERLASSAKQGTRPEPSLAPAPGP
jgi:hypothetical protein